MSEETALATVAVQPLTLFGTSDPVVVLERATRAASALAKVLNRQKLYITIGSGEKARKYITVEGWTLLGSMLGVFARVEWTHPIANGWEARAEAIVGATGMVIGAAEASCLRTEGPWRERDDYALRGMAQTRAISRALRGPLDFVVKLAGYATTPAEEVPR